jgi:hypothetical protein
MSQVRFFTVTAGNCGACKSLKSSGTMSKIESAVKSKGGKFDELYSETMQSPIKTDDHTPKFISTIGQIARDWFPTFIAMSDDAYEAISDGSLTGAEAAAAMTVFGAEYNPSRGRFVMGPGAQMSIDTILKWVDTNLKTEGYKRVRQPVIRQPDIPAPPRGDRLPPINPQSDHTNPLLSAGRDVGYVPMNITCPKYGMTYSQRR